MADRVEARRPGLALIALVGILAITAAWWALALWPLTPAAPEWVVRTRAACFGATRTGLPHGGGWLLLIGEPIGMLAALRIMWGRELHADLAALFRYRTGRLAAAFVVLLCSAGLLAAGQRVASARGLTHGEPFETSIPLPPRVASGAPALALVDQHGEQVTLDRYRGDWALLTFAFGHCDDICPLIVQDVQRSRRDAGAERVPLIVVTLDPWRDPPSRLPIVARSWKLGDGDRVLSGSVAEVNAALDAWGIARQRDPNTGEVFHGGTVVVIDPEGRIAWRIEGATARTREALAVAMSER